MIWEVNAKLKGEQVVLRLETDDECTRKDAKIEFNHSIPMVDGKFAGMPEKIDWRTLKAVRRHEEPDESPVTDAAAW